MGQTTVNRCSQWAWQTGAPAAPFLHLLCGVNELLVHAPASLNRHTRHAFRQAALAAVEQYSEGTPDADRRIVVDLEGTTKVDSAGLEALVMVRERAAEQRWTVCLRGASEELRFLLVLTRLEDRFEFEPPVT